MFLVILLFALFASLFSLSKGTLNYGEPFFLIGSRMTFAGIVLLAQQFIYRRPSLNVTWKHVRALFLLGFLNIYLTNVTEIWGIQYVPSAKACLIYSLSPFFAAMVAYFVLQERLSAKKWLGLLIGVMGLIPILVNQSPTEQVNSDLPLISKAELALLTAVFCSVYGWTLLKRIVNDYQYSPLMANGISMTIGGILALVHSYIAGEAWQPFPVRETVPFLQNTLLMCLISNIVCYNLYGYLLKRYSTTFMAFAGLITPFFAVLFGWYFLGETVTWHYFASMLVFSVGLSIFYLEELKWGKIFAKNDQHHHPLETP